MLLIKLIKSPIGNTPRNRATVLALGLRKINQVAEHEDNPTVRGMVHHVKHLLSVTEVEGTPKSNLANKRRGTAVAVVEKPAKAAKPKAVKAEEAPAKAEAKPKKPTKKAKTEEEN